MEPSDELLMLGQQEYKRKNYHAALDHLDSIPDPSVYDLAKLLEVHTKSLEKLGLLESQNLCLQNNYPEIQNSLALTHLEKLVLTDFPGSIRPEALPSLRVLELDPCPSSMVDLPAPGPMPDPSAESLVELSLMNNSTITIDFFLQLVELKPMSLKKLRLPNRFKIVETGMCTVHIETHISRLVDMGILDQVVDLDLTGLPLTDTVIKSLVLRAHQLESIKLALTDITGVGVKALVTKPGCKLRYLDISDCFQVSADAVAFARRWEGLTVKCDRQEIRGKKRIRYE
ncbi:MAG: hypothetical protein Q9178_004378 [Gyalolechia marmorata]